MVAIPNPKIISRMKQAERDTDWCVIVRTGTESDFVWTRSERMTRDEAVKVRDTLKRNGQTWCLIERMSRSIAIGLPSTYAAA